MQIFWQLYCKWMEICPWTETFFFALQPDASGSICPMFVFLFFNFMLFCFHQNVSVGDKSRGLTAAVSMGFADWIPPLSFSRHKTHSGSLFIPARANNVRDLGGKCDRPIHFCEFIFDRRDATMGGGRTRKKGTGGGGEFYTDVTWRPLFRTAIHRTSACTVSDQMHCGALTASEQGRPAVKNPSWKKFFFSW